MGRAVVAALAEFEAVAKAAAAIKTVLDKITLTLVSHKVRMQNVFRVGPHTLALTVPQSLRAWTRTRR